MEVLTWPLLARYQLEESTRAHALSPPTGRSIPHDKEVDVRTPRQADGSHGRVDTRPSVGCAGQRSGHHSWPPGERPRPQPLTGELEHRQHDRHHEHRHHAELAREGFGRVCQGETKKRAAGSEGHAVLEVRDGHGPPVPQHAEQQGLPEHQRFAGTLVRPLRVRTRASSMWLVRRDGASPGEQ